MKIQAFENNRHLKCTECNEHDGTMVLEVGHCRVVLCNDCVYNVYGMLMRNSLYEVKGDV